MCQENINVATQVKYYNVPESSYSFKASSAPPTSTRPLTLDNHVELVYHTPKGLIHKKTHNPSASVPQQYNIVEYISRAPCAMSTIEVLQICAQQHKDLLSTIGGVNPSGSNLITFNFCKDAFRLSHQTSFQIIVCIFHKNIHRTLVDGVFSTCIM